MFFALKVNWYKCLDGGLLMDEIKNELVSIVVPIYKVEKYLSACIDSLIQQTYKNIEIILVFLIIQELMKSV